MGFWSRLNLKTKVLSSVLATILLVAFFIILFGGYREYEKTKKAAQHEAKAILLQGEAVREMVATLNQKGAFKDYIEELKVKLRSDDPSIKEKAIKDFLDTVPVVSSIYMLSQNAKKGGYILRVPKVSPRNPKNIPDEVELKALERLKQERLKELALITDYKDPSTGKLRPAIRYFRPVVLTKECEMCHGDPRLSSKLWGNDQGFDPTGARMEGWKAGEIHGAFEIIYYLDEPLKQMIRNQIVVGGFILLGMLLVVVLVSIVVNRVVKRPIDQLIAFAERMASGDFTGTLSINTQDELGRLGMAFKKMQEGLLMLFQNTKKSAENVAASATRLLEVSEEMSQQSDISLKSAKEAAETSENASKNIETIASSVEDFSIASQEIATNVTQAASISNTAKEQMSRSSEYVFKLGESSEEIGTAIKLISDIAEQTNLLALNATIEAARAGEAGKGFAVVANEVKELAKQTAQAAEDITNMIQTIQMDTKSAVDAIEDVSNIIDQLNDINNTIASAVEEQTATVNEITTNISSAAESTKDVSNIVTQVADSSSHTSECAQETKRQAEHLAQLSEELSSIISSFKVRED